MCTVDRRAHEADRQLREGARVLAHELQRRRRSTARARILAALLEELLGDDTPAPVRAAARALRRRPVRDEARAARDGGVVRLASTLWRMLAEHDALTDERALVLATRLGRWLSDARVVLLFEHEAASARLERARATLYRAVVALDPGLHARAHLLPVDETLLAQLDLGDGVEARFHDDGHLHTMCVPGRAAPRLTLARVPGEGSYRDEGKRGGYGYATSERYIDGHASGTFCSPWHDGEEYRVAIPWLSWVVQCAGAIARAAQPASSAVRPRSPRRSRR